MTVSIDQQFIEYIIKSLVGNPDDVKIERRIDEKGVLLELSVNPEDLGRVIGKRGATAQSIRTLLRALGTKNDARYNLKIVDTGPPRERTHSDDGGGSAAPGDDVASAPSDDSDDNATASQPADDSTVDQPDESAKADDSPVEDDELPQKPSESTSHADVISRTRKELADLDDLDV